MFGCYDPRLPLPFMAAIHATPNIKSTGRKNWPLFCEAAGADRSDGFVRLFSLSARIEIANPEAIEFKTAKRLASPAVGIQEAWLADAEELEKKFPGLRFIAADDSPAMDATVLRDDFPALLMPFFTMEVPALDGMERARELVSGIHGLFDKARQWASDLDASWLGPKIPFPQGFDASPIAFSLESTRTDYCSIGMSAIRALESRICAAQIAEDMGAPSPKATARASL